MASQEETNRALRQSLEGYRQLVDRYAGAQERTARLVQCAVDDLKAAGEGQMEAARALLSPPAWATGATTATEPFTQLMQTWTDAFTRFSGGRQQIPDHPDLGDGEGPGASVSVNGSDMLRCNAIRNRCVDIMQV